MISQAMYKHVRSLAGTLVMTLGLLLAQVSWLVPQASAAPTGLPSGFSATTLINYNMTAPTSVRVAPDGRIFVFDLTGVIKIFTPNAGFNATNFGSVPVDASGDRGLLGAVFDRNFATNHLLYIHYVGTDDKVRIGRFDASTNVGSNFTVLYTAPDVSGFQHAGGGITMGSDNKIYFGIGDSGTPTNGQDLTKIHGKIHRINSDGTIPADNPFLGQAGVPQTIYDYGVRNPFRLTTDKQTGAIYVGDVGFSSWEEVNLIKSGKNYGWPAQEGPCTSACPYENPVYWYPHQSTNSNNTNDSAIIAGPVYRGSAYPASYQGKMFVSDYVQGFIRTIDPTVSSGNSTQFSSGNGSVVDMDVGPDGLLYFVTITSPTLYRLDYSAGGGNAAPTAQAGADVTTGAAPLTVHFNSNGSSDPEGQPLTYAWNFGDGTTSTQANPTKTYNTNGQYTVTLSVGDGVNTTPASALTIKVGTPPAVTITAPTASFKYSGGMTVNYDATAKDSNGATIPDANLKTTIILHHSDHTHPYLGPLTGGHGSFTTPTTGELSPDVWLHITVDATDSNGVTGSSSVDIQPNKATITVNTDPAGLNVVLDGSNHIIPPTIQGVAGMTRQIAAPSPQTVNGVQYVFDHWSDGGAQDHTFAFPATDTTYTAFYVPASGGGTQMQNVIANSSFEQLGSNSLPIKWNTARWGTNNAAYSLVTNDAHTGNNSVKMQTTSYTNGEVRLYNDPVTVAPSTVHSVGYFYKSDVQTKAVADVTLSDNTHKYIWLGINQPSPTTWREQDWALTTPANATKVVINLYLVSAGFLQVDDLTLLAPTSGSGTIAPAITLSASPTNITTGNSSTLTWSVAGTAPNCTASGAWSGALASSGTQTVSPSATSTYTLTCTNSGGTDTKSVTVTVNSTSPATGNIVPNPSFEDEDASSNPLNWNKVKWGTNDAAFSTVHGSAFDGDHNVKAAITTWSSGEASWAFVPQSATPNTLYTVNLYAKSGGPTKVQADVTLSDNTHKYIWLGTLPTAATWTAFTKTFTTPANATKVTVGAYLTGVGTMELDQFTLTPPATVTPPVVTLGASQTTITAGSSTTLSWSVTGTTPACTASDGWTGSKAVSGSQAVTPATTTTYTLTCTNSGGTDTKSVTITVNPVTAPTNLIANPSMEQDPSNTGTPLGWYKGGWGNNTTAFTFEPAGHTGTHSLLITTTNYVDGDAKWFFEPVAVTGGASYTFTSWYKASTNTELVAEYTLSDGSKSYFWLGAVPPASDWAQLTQTLTMPANATKFTLYHVLKANGTLQIDDYALTAN